MADVKPVANFSLPKILLWIAVSAGFVFVSAALPHLPGANEPTVLPFSPVLGTTFFGAVALCFIALILRILRSGPVAVFVSGGDLCWVRVFSVERLPMETIQTVSRWVTPGMVVLTTSEGRRRFLASGVTSLSSDALVERIRREMRAG